MSRSRTTDFSDPDKVVGYEVEVEFKFNSGKPIEQRHWLGSEATVRRKAAMLKNFNSVLSINPVKAGEWLRAYGHGRM